MGSIPDKGQRFFFFVKGPESCGEHTASDAMRFFRGVRRPGREADNLTPSNAKNQNSFYPTFSLCHHAEHRKKFSLNPLERLFDPEYEGTKYLRNVDNCLPADKPL